MIRVNSWRCFMLHISGISRPKVGSIVDVNLLITIVFDIKGKFEMLLCNDL